jgi:predicted AAA+ superfamily ATPase
MASIEDILVLQNKHWFDKYKELIYRNLIDELIKKETLKEIQLILGVRRSGKSTLIKLFINYLIKKGVDTKEILYINFEDAVFSTLWNHPEGLHSLMDVAQKITNKGITYLFLDEVQVINGWESFVKSVYDLELYKKIYVTGSNSALFKSDYTTFLSGRYIYDTVYPLSFKEILHAYGLTLYLEVVRNIPKVLNIIDTMMKYGSFPEVFKTDAEELKRSQLLSYYETILFKDCIKHNKIRDVKVFESFALYILTNIGTPYSYNSLARALGTNEHTVKDYIKILEDAFLIYEIKKFSYKVKEQIKNNKKIYIVDNGLINTVAFNFSENKGKLFENLVFTELIKNNIKEIYYYEHPHNKRECDFIIKKDNHFIPIQVCYSLTNLNEEREIKGLMSAMEMLSHNRGHIITYNDEKDIGSNISVMPFHKFFINLEENIKS